MTHPVPQMRVALSVSTLMRLMRDREVRELQDLTKTMSFNKNWVIINILNSKTQIHLRTGFKSYSVKPERYSRNCNRNNNPSIAKEKMHISQLGMYTPLTKARRNRMSETGKYLYPLDLNYYSL